MHLLLLGTASILVSIPSSSEGATSRERHLEIPHSTIFLKRGSPPFTEAKITGAVSEKLKKLIPDTNGKFAMIGVACNKVSQVGRLSNCKIEAEPETEALRAFALQATRDIVIDKSQVRAIGSNFKWISIQFRVTNSATPVTSGPCWPPSCNFHFIPPTPPEPLK